MSLSGDPIVILGSYRSGTSSVSTALVKLGLYMGEEGALFPADGFNPDGHWELRDMMTAHERILGALRTNYYPATWLPERWEDFPFCAAMVRDLRGLLVKHFSGCMDWGWKEPATSILLPLYQQALSDEGVEARYLICVRHPRSVVASMMKRFVLAAADAWSNVSRDQVGAEERLMSMWVSYTLSSLKYTQGKKRQLICYDRYLQTPKAYIDRIADGLLPWKATDAQRAEAVTTVKPQLSHNSFRADEGIEGWPSIVQKTFDFCLRADEDAAGFSSGKYDSEIDALWDEWMRHRRMVQPATLPASQVRFSWIEGSTEKEFFEKYSPTGAWQSMKISVNAPPGSRASLDLYHAPCRIWIRNAVWSKGMHAIPATFHSGTGGILEDVSGMTRLSIFGPHSLSIDIPKDEGANEFGIEMLLQCSESVLANILTAVGRRPS